MRVPPPDAGTSKNRRDKSSRSDRRSRVSFHQLVSVQEFSDHSDDVGSSTAILKRSEAASRSSETGSDDDFSIPPVSLIATPDSSRATLRTAPRVIPRTAPRATPRDSILEPQGSEEEEEGGEEEPRLATPNVKDMASFDGGDETDSSAESESIMDGYVVIGVHVCMLICTVLDHSRENEADLQRSHLHL